MSYTFPYDPNYWLNMMRSWYAPGPLYNPYQQLAIDKWIADNPDFGGVGRDGTIVPMVGDDPIAPIGGGGTIAPVSNTPPPDVPVYERFYPGGGGIRDSLNKLLGVSIPPGSTDSSRTQRRSRKLTPERSLFPPGMEKWVAENTPSNKLATQPQMAEQKPVSPTASSPTIGDLLHNVLPRHQNPGGVNANYTNNGMGRDQFNSTQYLFENPDVKTAVDQGLTNAWDHWNQFGRSEGRNPTFNRT